jgi:hypothetical protein
MAVGQVRRDAFEAIDLGGVLRLIQPGETVKV